MAKHPKVRFRTFKGRGSRLLRSLPNNDWINIQAGEGNERGDWKHGLLFTRTYAYQEAQEGRPAQHLYRIEATRLAGLDRVAEAFGRTSDEAWTALYADLVRKGVMPTDALELAD